MSNIEYSEIYSILLMLGKSYILKLPPEIFQSIKYNRDVSYEPKYSISSIEHRENFSQVVLEYIANLYLKYWQNNL